MINKSFSQGRTRIPKGRFLAKTSKSQVEKGLHPSGAIIYGNGGVKELGGEVPGGDAA